MLTLSLSLSFSPPLLSLFLFLFPLFSASKVFKQNNITAVCHYLNIRVCALEGKVGVTAQHRHKPIQEINGHQKSLHKREAASQLKNRVGSDT